jgi:hypothetical protein
MLEQYVRSHDECTYVCNCEHYLHYVLCQINMSDLMMNVQTCVTDNTTNTLLYVRSVYLI